MLPELYRERPAHAQAAYSELFETTRFASVSRSIADQQGSFAAKKVKGRRYWYYAFRDALDGKVRQIYVGPDSPALEAVMARAGNAPPASSEQIDALSRAALALGCVGLNARHFRIVAQMEARGFFNAGGVLVGSHAFLAYANLLGAQWQASAMTQDVDLAMGRPHDRISLAVPDSISVDVPEAIESLGMGFMPHYSLGASSYASRDDVALRIDFLTPAGRSGKDRIDKHLKIPLQSLRFLEYLLESPIQSALPGQRGGSVLVNVPDPARFAIHKVLVSGERPRAEAAKSAKDLDQAACLLKWHHDHRPADIAAARDDLLRRGSGWAKRFEAAWAILARRYPAVGRSRA